MKRSMVSCQLERSGLLNTVRTYGSPLPQQGEGEGEGLSKAARASGKTPHLSPLPFSKGRGDKDHFRSSQNVSQSPKLTTKRRFGE
jgi:hypothetical protein